MLAYYTSGQVARTLRVSVSTLKRWVNEGNGTFKRSRNVHGWMLFSESEVDDLKKIKQEKKRNGKMFSESTLTPAN